MFRKVLTTTIVTMMLMYSYQSQAIAISSLFEVAALKTHIADIEVINNDGRTMFINLNMEKVYYKDGKKILEKLNKGNINEWTFRVSPMQFILKAGERRVIRMSNKCADNCDFSEDQVYLVSVTPVPYDSGDRSSVSLAFGYKVYFLDPVKKMHINYTLKRVSKTEIYFDNRSNTMLKAILNFCSADFNNDCIHQYRLLPNSKRKFMLPNKVVDKSKLYFTVTNANKNYNEKITIHMN